MDLAAVLDFVDSGHDLIVAADTSASDLIKSIATECGVDFDEVSLDFMDFTWIYYEHALSIIIFPFDLFLISLYNTAGSIGYGH